MTSSQGPSAKTLGVIGWDDDMRLLLEHLSADHRYPRTNLDLVAWTLLNNAEVEGFEAVRKQSWEAVLEQPGTDLLYLAADAADNPDIMAAVAASGLETFCFLPCTLLENLPSALHISSHLRASLTGAQGLELVAAGEVGTVLALYIGYRMPRQPMEDATTALRRSLWEALDYTLAVVDSPLERLFYRTSALMGTTKDHVQLILRFESDCIASLDLLLLAEGVEPVLDIEITGREGLLQLRPHNHQVRSTSREPKGEGISLKLLEWHTPPVIQLIDDFSSAQPVVSQRSTTLKPDFIRLMERLEQRLLEATEGIVTF